VRLIKIPDILIILIASGVIFFSVYSAYMIPQSSLSVFIRGQDRQWSFPMETTETVTVNGPLGNTIVRIGGSRAWVESSPCLNQTCVASGSVSRHGQWAACLPNQVLVLIEGMKESGPDGIDVILR